MNEDKAMKELGRISTGAYNDYQEYRKAGMNRVRDVIRKINEDIPFDQPEEEKEDKDFDAKYKDENLQELLDKMKEEDKLTAVQEEYIQDLMDTYKDTNKIERSFKKMMKNYIEQEPIWFEWLENIKGISSVLASNLIKNFGYCEDYSNVAKLWKHCGLAVVNGRAESELKKEGKEISYSPKLRTLAWKVSDSFIKQRTAPYRGIYDSEKQRQLERKYSKGELAEKYSGYSEEDTHLIKGHAHNRAKRKMVKIFLQHYWVIGRQLQGLSTEPPYPIEKLEEHDSYIEPPCIPDRLKPFDPYSEGDSDEE